MQGVPITMYQQSGLHRWDRLGKTHAPPLRSFPFCSMYLHLLTVTESGAQSSPISPTCSLPISQISLKAILGDPSSGGKKMQF